MIFKVLKKNDTIKRGIWPQKIDTMSKNLRQTHNKILTNQISSIRHSKL